MDSALNKIFFDAIFKLVKKDIKGFEKEINNLHALMTCNCFLKGKGFPGMLSIIQEFEDDPSDYYLNLSKGFIFYFNHLEVESFKYLSTAISIDKSQDLPYSLRSLIASEININRIEDARIAISINPSARNFFLLANNLSALTEKEIQNEALSYYDKAINIESDFACAHNNKGDLHFEMKEYYLAIKEYKDCIGIEPSHWAYKAICEAYSKMGKYDEVLKYAEFGQKYFPEDMYYYLKIGVSYYYLQNNLRAIENLNIYLRYDPENLIAKNFLSISRSKVKNIALRSAIIKYREFDFQAVSEWLKAHIVESYGTLANRDIEQWENVFLPLLRIGNPRINIGIENPYYKMFDELKFSCYEKLDLGIKVTEEEEYADKMMVYGGNYTIGFGIFKGRNISSIIDVDPRYILRCIIKLTHFSISLELFLDPKMIAEPDFFEALEINIIKRKIIMKWFPIIEDDFIGEEENSDYEERDTYGKYNGSWAQDVEGLSDNFIDDALGGEPDAYWNID